MTISRRHDATSPARRLQQLSQVRERRALAACESRHRICRAAEHASHEAAEEVRRLHQAREDVLANVWQVGPCVTGQALQDAVQCAQHLAQQAQAAQRDARAAEVALEKAVAQWRDARAAQAAAQRESHKLGELLGIQARAQRRAQECRTERLSDEQGAARATAGRRSW